MKTNTKRLGAVALSAALLGTCSLIGELRTVSAEENDTTTPYECGAMELREGNGSDHVDYSTFDGVHLATLEDSTVDNGEVTLHLKPTVTDWSSAKYVYVQMESVNYTATLLASKAADASGSFFFLTNTAFVQNLGDTATANDAVQSVVNSGFSGYAKYDLTKQQHIVGDGESLLLSNVVLMQFTFYYGQKNKVNIGDIYIEDESGTTTKVLDASTLTEGGNAGQYAVEYNGYGAFEQDALAAATRVSKIKANEVKTYQNEKNQWQLWFAEIPADSSAYNGISYYIDNTLSEGELFFNKCLREAGGEHWFVDGTTGIFAQYVPDQGEPYVGNANVIPEDYKGTIIVPFSNLTTRPGATTQDGVLDLTGMFTRIEFALDTKNADFPSRDFIMKDVKLVADATQYQLTEQQVTPVGDTKIVNSFEYYDAFDLAHDWGIEWSLSATADLELVDSPAHDVTGVSGKALKVTCGTKTSVAGANQDVCIQWSLNEKQGNVKGAKGITYWIKNTSYTQVGFRVEFESVVNGQMQRWQSIPDCRYMLFNTKTGEERMMMGKEKGLYIPAGFEGYVRIEFSQFARPDWVTVGGDFTNENQIGTFFMIMNSTYHYADSYIIDSLGWYYSDVALTTTFTTPENSFSAAMSSDYFAD
ncbi:MAG: hypothetical protein K2L02_01640 [Clostridia bacterium]|nr:hypothetical protein [Clostridia bacterium]